MGLWPGLEPDDDWRGGPLPPDKQAFVDMLVQDAHNREAEGDLGAVAHSVACNPSDPAFILLLDGKTSTTTAPYCSSCYICRDPEYAAMGLPLCYRCVRCGGHIAADDENCDDCGWCINPFSQGPADGLSADWWPDGRDDPAIGDFETEEPFLVPDPSGAKDWRDEPMAYGDLVDDGPKEPGDYVRSLADIAGWCGTVVQLNGHPALRLEDGQIVPDGFLVTEIMVRVDDPAGSTTRRAGDIAYCRPGWLRVIRRAS